MKDTVGLYLKLWGRKAMDLAASPKYKGDGGPAHPVLKRRLVARYAKEFKCNTLVETGTYLGEMIEYQAKNFEKIYSIEVAELLYNFSSRRLRKKRNISVVKGDSSTVLGEIVRRLPANDRVLFWLDGHYSGGVTGMGGGGMASPVYNELSSIFAMRNGCGDVILIDDARCFDGTGGYPSLEELKRFIKDNSESLRIAVKEDIIRIREAKREI